MATLTTTQRASTSSLKRFIIHHPLVAFLGMVYSISWLVFVPPLLSANGLGVLPVTIPVAPFLLLSVIFGLTLPVYIVTRVTRGREGVRELKRRYPHWRVGIHSRASGPQSFRSWLSHPAFPSELP